MNESHFKEIASEMRLQGQQVDAEQQAKVEEMMQQRGHHKKPFEKMDKMKRK